MLTPLELSAFISREQCDIEIAKKWGQIKECVGWLYPSILQSEIEQLVNRKNELPQVVQGAK